MGSFFHRAAFLALVMIRVEWYSSAFSPYIPLASSLLRHSRPSSHYLHFCSKTNDDAYGDNGSTSRRRRLHQDEEEWTLKEDWVLMDLAPHFTVGSTKEQIRTFWTQLWISTPELSSKSCAEELFERYKLLLLAKDGEDEYQYPSLPMVGPSPDVLHEWSMDDNSKVTGQLSGRTVWFTAHLVGQIERCGDDSFSSSSNAGAATGNKAHPGGFVEAVGNRVYELGQPKNGIYDSTSRISLGNEKDDTVSLTGPWVTGTTAAISAFIASTILSAAIGYGAGLGIIADESSSSFARSTNDGLPTAVSTVKPIMPLTTNTGPSVIEQRAQMEARVLKEERVVTSISNMFEKDRIDLEQLRTEEKQPVQIVRSSNSNPIAEPSISEKRARKEAKVLREE
eukprot:scaffold108877_cov45-Attheya_sp.AAC.2